MLRNYRKPLVLAAPKIGLKHPLAVSPLRDFLPGTAFKPLYANLFGSGPKTTKVVVCSGKVYFDIKQKLEAAPPTQGQVLVLRLEELAPFPVRLVEEQLAQVSKSADVVYVQEEHMNEGAFQFAKLHVDRLMRKLRFTRSQEMAFVGRQSQHSFATGANINHKYETERLWSDFARAVSQ